MTTLTHLECSTCHARYLPDRLYGTCPSCGNPLFARYDLKAAAKTLTRKALWERPMTIWRYREVLPVQKTSAIATLGEGMTPLLFAPRLTERAGLRAVWVKDESQIPTGTFKARGLCVAVSKAKELGVQRIAIPSAGNAAAALSAYAARVGIEAFVFVPKDTPKAMLKECLAYGAKVFLVNGLINDCARLVHALQDTFGWFNIATLREPYRVEGKKTLTYEVWEQMEGDFPDAFIFPTGGGTGLIGMWKAFGEIEALGLGERKRRPRIVAVQAEGCAPLVRAFKEGKGEVARWERAQTIATGLRVPEPFASHLILHVLRESKGTAIAISDEEIKEATREMAELEGISACPEGGATWAALKCLVRKGFLKPEDRVVIFNTGSGLKYPEVFPTPSLPVLDPKDPEGSKGVIARQGA